MSEMDLDYEMRERQWRRKFEADPIRKFRTLAVAAIVLLLLIVVGRSVRFW